MSSDRLKVLTIRLSVIYTPTENEQLAELVLVSALRAYPTYYSHYLHERLTSCVRSKSIVSVHGLRGHPVLT
jgi:hypothetical protein